MNSVGNSPKPASFGGEGGGQEAIAARDQPTSFEPSEPARPANANQGNQGADNTAVPIEMPNGQAIANAAAPDPVNDIGDMTKKSLAMQAAMLAAQNAIQGAAMTAQISAASLNVVGQGVGAATAMAVQTVTDLVKVAKDSVKSQGEAFQKAN